MFNCVFVGGTFDFLHKGHRVLLERAIDAGHAVVIGLTSDRYTSQHKKSALPFNKRKELVKNYLFNHIHKIQIIEIHDALEPVVSDPVYEAIIVSEDTKKNAEVINAKRKQNNLSTLKIITVPLVLAEDNNPISSSRIRNGEIDAMGVVYVEEEWKKQTFIVSEEIRQKVKKPLGKIYKEISLDEPSHIVTVGDITTRMLNEQKLNHPISVIDFIVERKRTFQAFKELYFTGSESVIEITNDAGTINGEFFAVGKKSVEISKEKRVIIKVKGEEDLAVIPFILILPLGWKILYGQPQEGVVILEITEELKKIAHSFILASKTIR